MCFLDSIDSFLTLEVDETHIDVQTETINFLEQIFDGHRAFQLVGPAILVPFFSPEIYRFHELTRTSFKVELSDSLTLCNLQSLKSGSIGSSEVSLLMTFKRTMSVVSVFLTPEDAPAGLKNDKYNRNILLQ